MLEHERRCFITACELDESSFLWRNVIDGVPAISEVRKTDALLIGGSGHFSVADPAQSFFPPMLDLLREVVDVGHPTFGSCFGYQLLVKALGGRVEHDEASSEVGSYEVELTEDGREDVILGHLPDRFVAQMGHLDRAVVSPPGTKNLVRSDRCPYQALKVNGAPIWATQFHPELDRETNLDRYRNYIDRYSTDDGAADDSGFVALPSPETSRLLPVFLEELRSERR
jgi:GMP synthase (glutamine-hydrolysing)